MAVTHAVTQPVEVVEQMAGLLIRQFDDGVLVQRDATPDAIVVRWQQILQELIVGRKPLHLHIAVCRNVFYPIRIRYHYQVVLRNVVTMFIEHKTALASRAEQVHTSVAQLLRIHPVEVVRI